MRTPLAYAEDDQYRMMVYDADGNPVAQIISEDCEADATTICDSVNVNRAGSRLASLETNCTSATQDAARERPMRNCDRFETWEDAKSAYWREQGDPCDWRRLGAWLFAEVPL